MSKQVRISDNAYDHIQAEAIKYHRTFIAQMEVSLGLSRDITEPTEVRSAEGSLSSLAPMKSKPMFKKGK